MNKELTYEEINMRLRHEIEKCSREVLTSCREKMRVDGVQVSEDNCRLAWAFIVSGV